MTKNLKIFLIFLGVVVLGSLVALALQSPEPVEDVVENEEPEVDEPVIDEDAVETEEPEIDEPVVDEEWSCGDDFIDERDNQTYSTTKIGNQCWMSENLAYLPEVVGPATGDTATKYYYVYGYDGTDVEAAKATSNYQTYGVLYNHLAADNSCPIGWHLPTDEEWHTLEDYLATDNCSDTRNNWGCSPAGTILKANTALWDMNTGTDNYDFSALPGGFRDTYGNFYYLGSFANFWSSSEVDSRPWSSYYRYHLSGFSTVYRDTRGQEFGFSVRCLRDL